jgi:hypothetical protein
MNYKEKYKEFQTAKERAEQHSFLLIAMFDGIVEKQYNDLKSNYTKEHEELFCKNIDFLLKNM